MKTLVMCYSLTGQTRLVAETLAQAVGAEFDEIRCARYRPGVLGFFQAGYDSWRGAAPPIEAPSRPLRLYDQVVLAGPVWAARPATPLRSWLGRNVGDLPPLAVVLTLGDSGGEAALKELEGLAGKAPKAALLLRDAEIKSGRFSEALGQFAAALQRKQAA